jgi:hypothetical protein
LPGGGGRRAAARTRDQPAGAERARLDAHPEGRADLGRPRWRRPDRSAPCERGNPVPLARPPRPVGARPPRPAIRSNRFSFDCNGGRRNSDRAFRQLVCSPKVCLGSDCPCEDEEKQAHDPFFRVQLAASLQVYVFAS